MIEPLSDRDQKIGARVVKKHGEFAKAVQELFSEGVDRVALFHGMLRGEGRLTAIWLLPQLSQCELKELFGDLVYLASFSHGSIQMVREAILSMPREWVVDHIEAAAEPLLREGTYDEYRRLLELYLQLDPELARRLASRALADPDEDVREAGEDFMLQLDPERRPS